ncbi:uncharacterized protein LOC135120699 isoform X2 [Zophobas morio]|uniref:uncharacterized protein LOC135120699 isoform X2 n=1 Tax=Zophobas morio TaxID=2755281 RepID=UPI003082A9C1
MSTGKVIFVITLLLTTIGLCSILVFLKPIVLEKELKRENRQTLKLLEETKLTDLLPKQESLYEASGVIFLNSSLYIVFDSDTFLAKITNFTHKSPDNSYIFSRESVESEFEGLSYDSVSGNLFLLQEALRHQEANRKPRYKAKIIEISIDSDQKSYTLVESCRVEYNFKTKNKGLEGIQIFRGEDGVKTAYLICEGNDCEGGKAGKKGRGMVLTAIYKAATDQSNCFWEVTKKSELPRYLHFEDYSDLSISREFKRAADSGVWIANIENVKDVDWSQNGAVFDFPRSKKNKIFYCNVEGVAFLKANIIAVVSDKAKKKQPNKCTQKDRMLHIFEIPEHRNIRELRL